MKVKILALLGGLSITTAASACSDPSESWYRRNSAAVVDGTAICDGKQRSCILSVTRVLKNDLGLQLQHRKLDLDYIEDPFAPRGEDDPIIITCGGPHFEPEFNRFFGRFYLRWDEQTGDVSAWRFLVRDRGGRWSHPVYCESVNGAPVCEDRDAVESD